MIELTNKLKQFTNKATQVAKIVTSLQSAEIVGLFYTRIYPDGTTINLGSDAHWTEFYFKRLIAGAYQNQEIIEQYIIYPSISIWKLNSANQIWQDGEHYFGYGNGVTLSNEYNGFREVTSFYARHDNSTINHFYVNHIDALKKMREDFLLRAAPLIQEAERERLLSPYAIFSKNSGTNTYDSTQLVENRMILPNINTIISSNAENNCHTSSSQLCLIHKELHSQVYLPPQRSQCLKYLVQGKSTKEIARTMGLSLKTIEHYLEILRKELGCISSRDLIASYGQQVKLLSYSSR